MAARKDTESERVTQSDYFVTQGGQTFAGTHVLLEIWDAHNLNDPAMIEGVLRDGALAAGATILHSHIHVFQGEGAQTGGVTGVVLLAESHISIHTWPERGYAAIDIFMCGKCDPEDAIPVIEAGLTPGRKSVQLIRRGIV